MWAAPPDTRRGLPTVTIDAAPRLPTLLRRVVVGAAVAGTLASDAALLIGVPGRDILPLALLPPLAVGFVLWDALPGRRWIALAVPALLL
ncbi:hypothetical protein, partial [Acidisphaera rubrifaciens]|uniref:hypothetical protein n=1 Tax=Acidisphaera rubrifaciens TaxID=50715 RepID=UPI000662B7C5